MEKADAGNSPFILDAIAHKVHRHLGADFSGARRAELLRRLRTLAKQQGHADSDGWLEELAFAEWTDTRVQALVPAFAVGETYFRRDAAAFHWLAQHQLRPLLARRRRDGSRTLRLWSAACCTGEEAYGLLFLIDELLGAERVHWTIELVASDINEEFLAQAEEGLYGHRAFRGDDDDYRRHYFCAEGNRWRVRPAWRGRIRFVRFNLADDRERAPLQRADVILCRNVLMYFSPQRAASALQRLLACLAPDGVVMLSSVEAGIATQAGLKGQHAAGNYAVTHPTATAAARSPAQENRQSGNRRSIAGTTPGRQRRSHPARPARHAPAAADDATLPTASDPSGASVLPGTAAGPQPSQPDRQAACLVQARHWADRRDAAKARDWVGQALALDAQHPPAYWLLALVEEQAGNRDAALQALQKVLYLDPGFTVAWLLQARLLKAAGRAGASAKALQQCQRLLRQQPEATEVPYADGLSGDSLLRLCEQLQQDRHGL